MPVPAEDDIAAIERFVIDNDELLELEERVGRFNIFDALRVERAEIRHSNFLAWLLDPAESHGQGDLFLKAILMDVLRHAPRTHRPLSPAMLDGEDLHDIEIRREYRSIDLLILSKNPKLIVVVENKVDSGEHSNQLARYEEAVQREFPGIPTLFVFLTPDGGRASDEDWVTYSYGDLHRALSRVQRTAGGSLGGHVGMFLSHYLDLIGSRMMIDPQIDDLCKRIISKHRRALDLIYDRMPSPGTDVATCVREWIRERPSQWRLRDIGNSLFAQCVPACWVGTLSENEGLKRPGAPCDLFVEFESGVRKDHYLAARLVVGPGEHQHDRLEVIRRISTASPRLQMPRKQATTTWTRLGSATLLTWGMDDQPDCEAVRMAVATFMEPLEAEIGKLPQLLADLCVC